MSNPYQTPENAGKVASVASEVNAPAIALMIVSALAIVVGLIGFAGDAYLVQSGMIDRLEAASDEPGSEYGSLLTRTIWGIGLVVASSFVFFGAFQMKRLKDHGIARFAAVVAMIPCVGPCCFLGIPFGFWALVVLNKPEVCKAFE